MNRTLERVTLAAAALTVVMGPALGAQAVPAAAEPLAVGTRAPDFSLPMATANGRRGSVKLSDFRGKTVVLAFFFKARTKG